MWDTNARAVLESVKRASTGTLSLVSGMMMNQMAAAERNPLPDSVQAFLPVNMKAPRV